MNVNVLFSYILWDVDPEIFVIPLLDHPVRWYGLSWALGFLIGPLIMSHIYKKEGRPEKEVDSLTLYVIISAVVGARLGHVFFYDPIEFMNDPLSILRVWEGGLASHGAAIGILIALYFFAKKKKVPYLWILDRVIIVSVPAAALIRLGNLMNSEMVGLPTSLPWGFIFTSVDNTPRHPAQLYEAIYCLMLFAFLYYTWSKRRNEIKNGFLTGWFLIILFSLRFIDEFFKINQVSFEDDLVLNMGQLLSIPFVIVGIFILLRKQRDEVVPEV
ncbi:MAG TPA: prolipoprotein diacylglyceryl transferase [Chryseolinea sp.]|nr:prolipoprotein diacylglyceryl transferase [Chryseolinea sp.]